MKKIFVILFISFAFGLAFTPNVMAEEEAQHEPHNYQATMTPAYQEITGNRASWTFRWYNTPGPYTIYFSPNSEQKKYFIATVAVNNYNYSHVYSGARPKLHNASISIANAHQEPAFGDATVYRRP